MRTWAPCGQTPVLHQHLTNDHLACISAVSPRGALHFQVQRAAYDSAAVLRFLDAVHAAVPGKLLVIWDGAPIHRSQAIKDYLAQGAAAWLWLEPLPGYAPELNPDEGIWRYLKYVELKNVCCLTLTQLETVVLAALQQISGMSDIVQATFRLAGLA